MKQITQIGANVQEAISLALQQLGKTREQVDVEVLQEGKKGFLGFGARPAEVRVTIKEEVQEVEQVVVEEEQIQESLVEAPAEEVFGEQVQTDNAIEELIQAAEEQLDVNPIQEAKAYIESVAESMGINDLHIAHETEGKYTTFKLESEKAALLIGKRGQTLNALQQLTQLVLNKSAKSFMLVKIDVEDYRERRRIALEQLAERMADKAIRTGKKVVLEPMPSYERKIIHHALTNRLDIETYSEGVEPNRYLVIESLV
ncbi:MULTISPECIES: RNA-binding cell elongation regulator Jag/EloR [Bacillales]|uniref:RNA-binding protein KhpB n=1 Tax=Lysinibacillus louembei TaxID=1470088 RepID=A0ABZ0RXU1_9BACI|nr:MULTISPECIES: RNA-binding cell elongation regulator Jag/EloR [Bacillales]MCT6926108.1 protein jag [Metasolibacillus sp.]MCT6942307.1 protein jag [Metasolibacillus sp.]WPK13032.1 RNA-binding cell elongation regulator Jag/EloR [Lysinibacillus louembei]